MFNRFRRLRQNPLLRKMVRENHLRIEDFIYPLFIKFGSGVKTKIPSMPDIYQFSIDEVLKEIEELKELGIYSILLFGIPEVKDSVGSDALSENGIIATAIREIKKAHPEMFVITDLCFCEYTDHGHCGIIHEEQVDNDSTLDISVKQALIHAKAGADMIAPSGMMDGIIETLRKGLDENGFKYLPIMSYSTKFASGYYGPFRDVAESAPSFGDRGGYQMDIANGREALAESLEDEKQGADILMVKPALSYLDIIRDLKNNFDKPLACYNVSGEYAMIKAAAEKGWIDGERVMMETLLSMKRAGADIIITYFAKEAARLMGK